MLRPGRLLFFGIVAFLVYYGFFAVPGAERGEGRFTPEKVAEHEAAQWKALKAQEDFGIYSSAILMARELHHFTWFTALQAGYYQAHASWTFQNSHSAYDRVLPDLTAAARIEREQMPGTFTPAVLARAQLNWWIGRRQPMLDLDQMTQLIAEEFALRYHVSADSVREAAQRRAEAVQMLDKGGVDPDWAGITKLLTQAYQALRETIRPADAAARGRAV